MADRKRFKSSKTYTGNNNFGRQIGRQIYEKSYNTRNGFYNNDVREFSRSDFDYFTHVFNRAKDPMEDEEELEIYLKNVYAELKGREKQILAHKTLSFLMDDFLNVSTLKYLVPFIEGVLDDYELLTNAAAVHVLEKFLEMTLKQMGSTEFLERDKISTRVIELITNLSTYVKKNLSTLLENLYAPHVISSLLQTLAGFHVRSRALERKNTKESPESGSGLNLDIDIPAEQIPQEFQKALKRLLRRLLRHAGQKDLLWSSHSSKVFQTALLIMSKRNSRYLERYVESINECLFNDASQVMDVISDPCIAPVVETVLGTCPSSQFTIMWDNYFKGSLKEMAIHKNANFVAQQLLRSCPTKQEVKLMFAELEDSWDDIGNLGHVGVIVALADACVKHNTHQQPFMQKILKLMHITKPADHKLLVPLLLTWKFCEDFKKIPTEDAYSKIFYLGSVLVQTLLKFDDFSMVMTSIMELDSKVLAKIFCDQCGSYILDAFASISTVDAATRARLVHKLQGHFIELASSKYGSWCLEAFWDSLNIGNRVIIAKEFSTATPQQRYKECSIFYTKHNLAQFKTNPAEWKRKQRTPDNSITATKALGSKRKNFRLK